MKKINLLFPLILLTIMFGCKKNDLDEVKPVSVAFDIAFDENVSVYNFSMLNTEVKLTNLTNGQVTHVKSDAAGKVSIQSLSPGLYDVQAVLSVSAADYSNATGTQSTEAVVFNALLKSQSIVQATNTISLKLKTGRVGNWLIKQIYYAGSHTTNGASFRDQFIEIYNNSNEVLYADSLYFSQIYGTGTKTNAIDITKSYYRTDTKQFDWTKSIGMNDTKANSDYVYAKSLLMVPGTGKQYPVQPGGSIIIAATALNHKSPYTDVNGTAVTVKDPNLTIDLSGADFEVYLGNYPGISPLASDVDVPSVPNLVVLEPGNRDLVLDATGRDAYVIFQTSQDVSKFPKFAAPDQLTVTTTTQKYYQIPAKLISDGVEIQPPVATNQIPKKLEPTIDAGYVFVSKGQYSSQSLLRKTAKTVNGRKVLQDTNNSANDFTELNIPDVTKTVFK